MGQPSATYRLADLVLKGSLDEFVRTRRAEGRAWRLISRDLYEHTSGEIDVTHESLRAWFPEYADIAADKAAS